MWSWRTLFVVALLMMGAAGLDSWQHCLQNASKEIDDGCSAIKTYRNDSSIVENNKTGIMRILLDCIGREVRIFAPNLTFAAYVSSSKYTPMLALLDTALQPAVPTMNLTVANLPSWGRSLSQLSGVDTELLGLDPNASAPGVFDAWMVDPIALADMYDAGLMLDLSQVVLEAPYSSEIDWVDIHQLFRSSVVVDDKGRTTSLPFGGLIYQMYYRHDILAANNLTVPATWDDFVDVAKRVNGTDMDGDGRPDYGVCLQRPRYCFNGFSLAAIWSSFVQSQGTKQGAFFDPDTLKPLVANEAMSAAMGIFVQLRAYGPPDETTAPCLSYNANFLEGRCALTLSWSYQIKANTFLKTSRVRDKASVALLPGSTMVLNRATGQLVPCDMSVCPYAKELPVGPDRQLKLVNRAPYLALATVSAAISAAASPWQQTSLLRFFAHLSSRNVSWDLVTDPNTELGPYRYVHFDPTNLGEWERRGYPRKVIAEFLAVMKEQVDSPNVLLEVRTLQAYAYRRLMDMYATQLSEGNISIDAASQGLSAKLERVYGTGNPQRETIRRLYRYSIGVSSMTSTSLPRPSVNTAAIVVPALVGGILALVVMVLALYAARQQRRQRTAESVPKGHPGLGEDTTLLVSDVEGSTVLWEVIEAGVMDVVFNLHHDCMRRTAVRFGGYESQTEGDSFIIAFHTADDAVQFALAVQQALLDEPWPRELLAHEKCRPVWLSRTGVEVPLDLPCEPAAMTFPRGAYGGDTTGGSRHGTLPVTTQGSAGGSVMSPGTMVTATNGTTTPEGGDGSGTGGGVSQPGLRMLLAGRWGSRPRVHSVGGTASGVVQHQDRDRPSPQDGTAHGNTSQGGQWGVGTPLRGWGNGEGTSWPQGQVHAQTATSFDTVGEALRLMWREVPPPYTDPWMAGGGGGSVVLGNGGRWQNVKAAFRTSLSYRTPLRSLAQLPPSLTNGVIGAPETLQPTLVRSRSLPTSRSETCQNSESIPQEANTMPSNAVGKLEGTDIEVDIGDGDVDCYGDETMGSLDMAVSTLRSRRRTTTASMASDITVGPAKRSSGGDMGGTSIEADGRVGSMCHGNSRYAALGGIPVGGRMTTGVVNLGLNLGRTNVDRCTHQGTTHQPSLENTATWTLEQRTVDTQPLSPLSQSQARHHLTVAQGPRSPQQQPAAAAGHIGLASPLPSYHFVAAPSATLSGTVIAEEHVVAMQTSPASTLVRRGLSVRIGIHSGVRHSTDLQYSEVAARWKYSGEVLAAAKAVSDAANGGDVLFSESCLERLTPEILSKRCRLLWIGRHVLRGGEAAATAAAASAATLSRPLPPPGPGGVVHLYAVYSLRLLPRLALYRPPRTEQALGLSTLDAPLGSVAYGLIVCHGVASMALHPHGAVSDVALEAQEALTAIAADQFMACHGVAAALPSPNGHPTGAVVGAFRNPYHAILWALQAQEDLLRHPWSPELLAHEHFEAIVVPAAAADAIMGPALPTPPPPGAGPEAESSAQARDWRTEATLARYGLGMSGLSAAAAGRIVPAATDPGLAMAGGGVFGGAAMGSNTQGLGLQPYHGLLRAASSRTPARSHRSLFSCDGVGVGSASGATGVAVAGGGAERGLSCRTTSLRLRQSAPGQSTINGQHRPLSPAQLATQPAVGAGVADEGTSELMDGDRESSNTPAGTLSQTVVAAAAAAAQPPPPPVSAQSVSYSSLTAAMQQPVRSPVAMAADGWAISEEDEARRSQSLTPPDEAASPLPPPLLPRASTGRTGPAPGAEAEGDVVLYRGPRIKGTISYGVLKATLDPLTGLVRYEGKAVTHAAKMLSYASVGMVVASVDAVEAGHAEVNEGNDCNGRQNTWNGAGTSLPGSFGFTARDAPSAAAVSRNGGGGGGGGGGQASYSRSLSVRASAPGVLSRAGSFLEDPEGPSAAMAAAAAAAAAALLNLVPMDNNVANCSRSPSLTARGDSLVQQLAVALRAGGGSGSLRGELSTRLRAPWRRQTSRKAQRNTLSPSQQFSDGDGDGGSSMNSEPLAIVGGAAAAATAIAGGNSSCPSGYSTPFSGPSYTYNQNPLFCTSLRPDSRATSRTARTMSNLNPDSRQASRTHMPRQSTASVTSALSPSGAGTAPGPILTSMDFTRRPSASRGLQLALPYGSTTASGGVVLGAPHLSSAHAASTARPNGGISPPRFRSPSITGVRGISETLQGAATASRTPALASSILIEESMGKLGGDREQRVQLQLHALHPNDCEVGSGSGGEYPRGERELSPQPSLRGLAQRVSWQNLNPMFESGNTADMGHDGMSPAIGASLVSEQQMQQATGDAANNDATAAVGACSDHHPACKCNSKIGNDASVADGGDGNQLAQALGKEAASIRQSSGEVLTAAASRSTTGGVERAALASRIALGTAAGGGNRVSILRHTEANGGTGVGTSVAVGAAIFAATGRSSSLRYGDPLPSAAAAAAATSAFASVRSSSLRHADVAGQPPPADILRQRQQQQLMLLQQRDSQRIFPGMAPAHCASIPARTGSLVPSVQVLSHGQLNAAAANHSHSLPPTLLSLNSLPSTADGPRTPTASAQPTNGIIGAATTSSPTGGVGVDTETELSASNLAIGRTSSPGLDPSTNATPFVAAPPGKSSYYMSHLPSSSLPSNAAASSTAHLLPPGAAGTTSWRSSCSALTAAQATVGRGGGTTPPSLAWSTSRRSGVSQSQSWLTQQAPRRMSGTGSGPSPALSRRWDASSSCVVPGGGSLPPPPPPPPRFDRQPTGQLSQGLEAVGLDEVAMVPVALKKRGHLQPLVVYLCRFTSSSRAFEMQQRLAKMGCSDPTAPAAVVAAAAAAAAAAAVAATLASDPRTDTTTFFSTFASAAAQQNTSGIGGEGPTLSAAAAAAAPGGGSHLSERLSSILGGSRNNTSLDPLAMTCLATALPQGVLMPSASGIGGGTGGAGGGTIARNALRRASLTGLYPPRPPQHKRDLSRRSLGDVPHPHLALPVLPVLPTATASLRSPAGNATVAPTQRISSTRPSGGGFLRRFRRSSLDLVPPRLRQVRGGGGRMGLPRSVGEVRTMSVKRVQRGPSTSGTLTLLPGNLQPAFNHPPATISATLPTVYQGYPLYGSASNPNMGGVNISFGGGGGNVPGAASGGTVHRAVFRSVASGGGGSSGGGAGSQAASPDTSPTATGAIPTPVATVVGGETSASPCCAAPAGLVRSASLSSQQLFVVGLSSNSVILCEGGGSWDHGASGLSGPTGRAGVGRPQLLMAPTLEGREVDEAEGG